MEKRRNEERGWAKRSGRVGSSPKKRKGMGRSNANGFGDGEGRW